MLPVGHSALSYILTKSSALIGYDVSVGETLFIVLAGNVVDFDIILMLLSKKKISHHNFITHTPAGVFLLWLIFMALFGRSFSLVFALLVLAALLLHLVCDELGFWLCKLGLQKISVYHQINWFYPRTKFKNYEKISSIPDCIKNYIQKAKANIVFEIFLLILAFLLFVM